MRSSIATVALLASLLISSGCSSTSGRSFWPSFLSKSKSPSTSGPALSSTAPTAPTFNPAVASTTNPGAQPAATTVNQSNYYTPASYPVTPYPSQPAMPVAAANGPTYQPAAPSGGYMPASPAATAANPYAADPSPAAPYTPAQPYSPGGTAPYNAAGQPGTYVR